MRTALTISVLFFLAKAKAQDLRSVTVRNKSIEVKYDSVILTAGVKYDTTFTKSCTKYKNTSTCKIDTTYTQSKVSKSELMTITKTFLKPVEMKFIFSALTATVFALNVNGQIFSTSKYGFGWYTDTTGYTPPPASAQIFGALWATWSGSQAIQATNNFLPFSEIRSLVMFSVWNGSNSPITEQYLTSNKKVLLNVHDFSQDGTHSYSEINLATWQSNVTTLVNSISKPADVVLSCFNEEANRNYSIINTPSDMQKYVQALSALARTAYTRDIKASNGGITTNSLVFTTYRWLSDNHSADTVPFLQYCVPRNWWNGLRNRSSDAIEEVIANTQYLLTRYDTIPAQYLPYISAHLYFPLAVRITDTATNWTENYTGITQVAAMLNAYVPGRELITNEYGLVVDNTALMANVVADLRLNNFKHILYWNSPAGTDEVIPIATAPDTPTDLGNFYKQEINL